MACVEMRSRKAGEREHKGREKEGAGGRGGGGGGNFGEMRRSGWVRTGHVKRNESRSRTWLGRDPRYPDRRSRSASFLCREFKLDTTTRPIRSH